MRRFFYDTHSNDSNDNDFHHDKAASVSLNTLSVGHDVALTETIVHHWCRVLRANIGDEAVLFDGLGGEYHVRLHTVSKKQATVTVLAHDPIERTAPIISHIGLVMSRGERMDYAIQKATELGVTAIQLLSSQHGEVNLKPAQVEKKLLHWQQVAISACEQCGLNRPPLILAPMPIAQWLQLRISDSPESEHSIAKQPDTTLSVSPFVAALSGAPYYQALHRTADLRLVLSVPAENQPATPAALNTLTTKKLPHIELLIGSEGGLNQAELEQAAQAGFEAWQIGDRVLRTETAPVVALSTLHALIQSHSYGR